MGVYIQMTFQVGIQTGSLSLKKGLQFDIVVGLESVQIPGYRFEFSYPVADGLSINALS